MTNPSSRRVPRLVVMLMVVVFTLTVARLVLTALFMDQVRHVTVKQEDTALAMLRGHTLDVVVSSPLKAEPLNHSAYGDVWRVERKLISECHVTRPFNSTLYHGVWHRHQEGDDDILAVSVFYDDRPPVGLIPVLRILAVVQDSKLPKFCQVWYENKAQPYITPVKTHDNGRGERFKGVFYKQYLYTCDLPGSLPIPSHVSISIGPCNQSSILMPVYVPTRAPPEHEFGVCVAIAFGSVDYSNFVEWIELNRIFGVTEFTIYNSTISPSMRPLFKYYQDRGVLRIIDMPPPVEDVSVKSAKMASPASLNDCMYRNAYRYKHMVVIDFDEFIVPQKHTNYTEMMKAIDQNAKLKTQYWSYTFRNVFHLLQVKPDNEAEKLFSLRHQKHAKPSRFMYAPKSIVDPRRCLSVFNHYCWIKFPDTPKPSTIDVPTDIATSHHYRKCNLKDSECNKMYSEHAADDIMERYRVVLQHQVSNVLQSL